MEFHHTASASSTAGSTPEHPTLASDDLEIDAAQGGANKAHRPLLSHAYHTRELLSMLQRTLSWPTISMAWHSWQDGQLRVCSWCILSFLAWPLLQ